MCVCVCDHKNVALWKAVKGAVNLEEEGEGRRPTRAHASPNAGGPWIGHLPLVCCWGCELRSADTLLSWTGQCQPSAPRWSLRKAGCTTSPSIRSPSAHTGGSLLARAHVHPSQKQRSTHLSIVICALRHVQNPVHLHVIRVKRLVIHLETTRRHLEGS